MKMTKQSSDGFTLIEIMIATLVLGIGLGSAVLAMGTAMQWVRLNRMREFAIHANREAMETARTMPLSVFETNTQGTITNLTGCDATFNLSYDSLRLSPAFSRDVYRVTTVVRWNDPFVTGRIHSNELVTIMTEVMR